MKPQLTDDLHPQSRFGVLCTIHGEQGLTRKEYDRQMNKPDSLWQCPLPGCDAVVQWDDDRYEDHTKIVPEE